MSQAIQPGRYWAYSSPLDLRNLRGDPRADVRASQGHGGSTLAEIRVNEPFPFEQWPFQQWGPMPPDVPLDGAALGLWAQSMPSWQHFVYELDDYGNELGAAVVDTAGDIATGAKDAAADVADAIASVPEKAANKAMKTVLIAVAILVAGAVVYKVVSK